MVRVFKHGKESQSLQRPFRLQLIPEHIATPEQGEVAIPSAAFQTSTWHWRGPDYDRICSRNPFSGLSDFNSWRKTLARKGRGSRNPFSGLSDFNRALRGALNLNDLQPRFRGSPQNACLQPPER